MNEGVKKEELLLYASLSASNHSKEPIEMILASCVELLLKSDYHQTNFEPFDPVSKRTSVDVLQISSSRKFTVVKGAPQVLFDLPNLPKGEFFFYFFILFYFFYFIFIFIFLFFYFFFIFHFLMNIGTKEKVDVIIEKFAMRGLRSIGIAKKEEKSEEWEYLGIVPLFDPPRGDSRKMLEETMAMGIEVKMLTGDHLGKKNKFILFFIFLFFLFFYFFFIFYFYLFFLFYFFYF